MGGCAPAPVPEPEPQPVTPVPETAPACSAPAPAPAADIGFEVSPPAGDVGVRAWDNVFSGYSAAVRAPSYDKTSDGRPGSFDVKSGEYVAPLDGVYHMDYYARALDTATHQGVKAQVGSGGRWRDVSPELWFWNDGEANRRFVSWSADVVMQAGDRFRIVACHFSITFRRQQLSGYFVGAKPLGALAIASSAHAALAGTSVMARAPVAVQYDYTGDCQGLGFDQHKGYGAPRTGLYEITHTIRYNDGHVVAGIAPQLNGVSYLAGGGGAIYAWTDGGSPSPGRRLITYSVVLPLALGDVFGLLNTANAEHINWQSFSARFIGDAPVGFSVRYDNTYACTAGTSMTAAATGRAVLYDSDGALSDGGFTAPASGIYHFNLLVRFADQPATSASHAGVYVTVNDVRLQEKGMARMDEVLHWDDMNGNRRFVSYTFDVPLGAGDVLQLRASASNTVVYQELSGYRIGDVRTLAPTPAPTVSLVASKYLLVW